MSAGFNASGSMPAWLMSDSRHGEPEASTNLGRPIMGAALTNRAKRERVRTARTVAEGEWYHNTRRASPPPSSFPLPLVGRVDRLSGAKAVGVGVQFGNTATPTPVASLATLPTRGRVRRLLIPPTSTTEPLADVPQKLVAHGAVGVEPLLAAAFDGGRVGRRPILDVGGDCACQFQRLVVRRRRQRDDEVEVQPLELVQLLEGDRLVARDVDADLVHHRHDEGIELALLHPGRRDVEALA